MGVSSEPRRLKMPRKGITRKEHTSELQSHDNLVCRFLEFRRVLDRKSTRLNSSHTIISYAVFCLKKNKPTPRPFDVVVDQFPPPTCSPRRSPGKRPQPAIVFYKAHRPPHLHPLPPPRPFAP